MFKQVFLAGFLFAAGTSALTAQNITVHTIGDSTMADYAENTTRHPRMGRNAATLFQ